jgi:hypothetical protein
MGASGDKEKGGALTRPPPSFVAQIVATLSIPQAFDQAGNALDVDARRSRIAMAHHGLCAPSPDCPELMSGDDAEV